MTCEDFIINFLNKEDNNTIKLLMSANLNSNFTLSDASTDISNKIDRVMENNDDDETIINNILDKKIKQQKESRIRKYIKEKLEVNNYFPYEQKKLRRENPKNQFGNKNIYNVLNKLQDLNKKIKAYKRKNNEKESKIDIELSEEDDIDINDK